MNTLETEIWKILKERNQERALRFQKCHDAIKTYKTCVCCGRQSWQMANGTWRCRDRMCVPCRMLEIQRKVMSAKVALEQERRPLEGYMVTIGISKDSSLPRDLGFRIDVIRSVAQEINKILAPESSVFRKWECVVSREGFFPHMHYVCVDATVEQVRMPDYVHFHKLELGSAQEIRNAIQYLYKVEVSGLEFATRDMLEEVVSHIANVRAFWRTGFFMHDIPRKSGAQFCATCGGEYRILEESDVGGESSNEYV